MILGIGLFGTFAAALTSMLTHAEPEEPSEEILRRLESIDDALHHLLEKQGPE